MTSVFKPTDDKFLQDLSAIQMLLYGFVIVSKITKTLEMFGVLKVVSLFEKIILSQSANLVTVLHHFLNLVFK